MKARRRMMFAAGLWVALAGLAGCHLWYQDMKGYLDYWTETVATGRLTWEASPKSQLNSSGVNTIPTNARVTATVDIDNPDGYSLDYGVGSERDTLRSVRIAGASGPSVLPLAKVTDSSPTSITLAIEPASSVPTPESLRLEHTDFTVTFIPTRTENGKSAPTTQTLGLRYNTPPRMPLEVVEQDGKLEFLGPTPWEMVQGSASQELDGRIYWAWPKDKTEAAGCDLKDPDCATRFQVY